MKKVFLLIIPLLLITGCVKDDSYNKALCNGVEYEIDYITRWSDSNYSLKLKNGERIEVHPMNCTFYN